MGDDTHHETPAPKDDRGRSFPASRSGAAPEVGDEAREHTGEPVETDEGWVLPQQQNVGPGNQASNAEVDPTTDRGSRTR
jgi:hypothetical protein